MLTGRHRSSTKLGTSSSLVPPPEIRRLRMLTRYRMQLMGDPTPETTRLELMLADASIKLSSVASSLNTVSARATLAAMIDSGGSPDPMGHVAGTDAAEDAGRRTGGAGRPGPGAGRGRRPS